MFDAPRKANGRAVSVTWARISPMTPPWLKMTTVWPRWAATMRSTAPRTRVRSDSADSAPGMTSQRCSVRTAIAVGWPSAMYLR